MTDKSFTALAEGREHDPFRLLGVHPDGDGWRLTVYRPHASAVSVQTDSGWRPLSRKGHSDVFQLRGTTAAPSPYPYLLKVVEEGTERVFHDPYAFPPGDASRDFYLFNQGTNFQSYRLLGAQAQTRDGVAGICFRVWAPNAERVSVVGDFNRWDGRTHPMCSLGSSGAWELFIPDLPAGSLYKFEIRNRHTQAVMVKADPYARRFEKRPATAALTPGESRHDWTDADWLDRRGKRDWLHAPMTIYEMHIGSWMRHPDNRFYTYRELAERLPAYVADMGYTHVEFLPLMEHPLDESWGYQCTGFFAPTSRFGTPDDLKALIDALHRANIGVLLDWVPGHFPADAWALAHFDGSSLYEHEDPRLGKHQEWGTLIFNYGRNEVRSFLLSSAHCWLSEFHIDGLRVDAVASMLYLDYARKEGEWLPNKFGGRENLEAIEFLRALNEMVHREFPGALTMAEESTAWPMVSRPVYLGGLGFSMKWNMGWMNDTLDYIEKDPVHRRFHHDRLTFGQLYAYTENFILPLSHDEVVHGKSSLLGKMPGDEWQRFANLRALLTYQMTTPGKKLLFMGGELAQGHEWRDREELAWHLLQYPLHEGMQRLVRDLNRLYVELPALHDQDFSAEGFSWIDCHDADQSVISWLRWARDGSCAVVVLNLTPVPRRDYHIGVPRAGEYRERFNSDSRHYGGSDMGNAGTLVANDEAWMGRPASLLLMLPPLAGLVLVSC
ncbi:MAG TPA: 1,4-alpha-glucan branching protein GlgB [Rhodocyclaceae bacterium]|nr:1,4-alpha-glucan branching protein GlgB [Rhodocyclaceae bacterium]